MNKTLAALSFCLWFGLSTNCFSEIRINWLVFDAVKSEAATKDSQYSKKQKKALLSTEKKKIAEAIKEAALKYTTPKYASNGPYDVTTCNEIYTIVLAEDEGYYSPPEEIRLEVILTCNLNMLKREAVHEFSHVYDFKKLDLYKKFSDEARMSETQKMETPNLTELREELETRATRREHLFIEEIKEKIPIDIYEKLTKCYAKGYLNAYYSRDKIYDEWLDHDSH